MSPPKKSKKILGLETDQIANITLEEIKNNEAALKMFIHYYKLLSDENSTLKNENNTLKTYVDAYGKQKTNSRIASGLSILSNIGIGFGINLLTTNPPTNAGWLVFIFGFILAITSIYFNHTQK